VQWFGRRDIPAPRFVLDSPDGSPENTGDLGICSWTGGKFGAQR